MLDKIKFILALSLLAGGVFGFYYLAEQALILRVLAVLGGVLLAALVAWQTDPGKRFYLFAQEAWIETKKVVWPSRKETVQTTAAVFAFVVVMSIFLYLTDKALEWVLYELILGWKKL